MPASGTTATAVGAGELLLVLPVLLALSAAAGESGLLCMDPMPASAATATAAGAGELLLVLPVLLARNAAAGELFMNPMPAPAPADVEGGVWDVVWTLPLLPAGEVERCVLSWSFIDPGHAQQGLSGKRQARGTLKGRALQGTQLRFLAHNARQPGRRVSAKKDATARTNRVCSKDATGSYTQTIR